MPGVKENLILALDPGRDKSGIALLTPEGQIILHKVVATACMEEKLQQLQQNYNIGLAVMGDGTTSRKAKENLQQWLPGIDVKQVNEYRTTDMARKRYWQENKPKGWRRFLPTGMQVPPEPVDDWAAVIIAEIYLVQKEEVGKNG